MKNLILKDFYKEHIKKGILFHIDKDTLRGTGKDWALEELKKDYVVLTKEYYKLKYSIPESYSTNDDYVDVLVNENIDAKELRFFTIFDKKIRVVGGFTNNTIEDFRKNGITLKCDYIDLNNVFK